MEERRFIQIEWGIKINIPRRKSKVSLQGLASQKQSMYHFRIN